MLETVGGHVGFAGFAADQIWRHVEAMHFTDARPSLCLCILHGEGAATLRETLEQLGNKMLQFRCT